MLLIIFNNIVTGSVLHLNVASTWEENSKYMYKPMLFSSQVLHCHVVVLESIIRLYMSVA